LEKELNHGFGPGSLEQCGPARFASHESTRPRRSRTQRIAHAHHTSEPVAMSSPDHPPTMSHTISRPHPPFHCCPCAPLLALILYSNPSLLALTSLLLLPKPALAPADAAPLRRHQALCQGANGCRLGVPCVTAESVCHPRGESTAGTPPVSSPPSAFYRHGVASPTTTAPGHGPELVPPPRARPRHHAPLRPLRRLPRLQLELAAVFLFSRERLPSPSRSARRPAPPSPPRDSH
jgi:hypothetical protein